MTSLPDLRSISTSKLDLENARYLAEQYKLYIPKNADLEFIRSTLRLIKKNFNDLPNYQKERERAVQYILTTVKLSDELKDQFPDLHILEKTLRQNFRLQETGENSRPSTPLVKQTSQTEFVFPEKSLEQNKETKHLSLSTPNLLEIPAFKKPVIPPTKLPNKDIQIITNQDPQIIQVEEPQKVQVEIIKQDTQIQTAMADRKRPFFTPQSFSAAPHENISEFIQNYKRVAKANSWDNDDCLMYLPFYLKGSAAQYFETISESLQKQNTLNFENVTNALLGYFEPIASLEKIEIELMNRKMSPRETIQNYMAHILFLCQKYDSEMSEKRKIRYILRGLLPHILDKIIMLKNDTMAELENNIQKFELSQFITDDRVGLLPHSSNESKNMLGLSQHEERINNLSNRLEKLIKKSEEQQMIHVVQPSHKIEMQDRPQRSNTLYQKPKKYNNTQHNEVHSGTQNFKNKQQCAICHYQNHTTENCYHNKLNQKNQTNSSIPNKKQRHCAICNYRNHNTDECYYNGLNKKNAAEKAQPLCEICKKSNHTVDSCEFNKLPKNE